MDTQYEESNSENHKTNVYAYCPPTAYVSAQKYDRGYWLRSPGTEQNTALIVTQYGQIFEAQISDESVMVRPALWIDNTAP